MKKRLIFIFSVFILFVLFCFANTPKDKKGYRIKTVVIDSGHGGKDPGAVGSKVYEKDVVLKVALKLGNLIETNFPDVKVVFTRKSDVFVELYRRAQIANQNKADLFISIHCNSSKNTTAFGSETYVMGLHKSQENLEVAKKENSSILLEDNYSQMYDGFDPKSPESNIIFSLYQNAYIDQSLMIAQKIQHQMSTKVGFSDRGVKQAGFLVLYKAAMPSILTEIGFVSNKSEEEVLISEQGTNKISNALFNAFKEYKENVESDIYSVDINPENKKTDHLPPIDTIKKTKDTIVKKTEVVENKDNTTTKKVSFRVQFTASSTNKPLNSPEFSKLKDVKVYQMNSLYRYTTGDFKTLEEAAEWQSQVQSKGFKDAFVVAFYNEERISPQEAIKLIKNN